MTLGQGVHEVHFTLLNHTKTSKFSVNSVYSLCLSPMKWPCLDFGFDIHFGLNQPKPKH